MSQHAELEHAIGYNGSVPNSLLVLPSHAPVTGFAPASASAAPPPPLAAALAAFASCPRLGLAP